MGYFSPGYGNRMDRQERAGGDSKPSKPSGKKVDAPKFDNWEGRGKNGFAQGGYPESGLKPVGTTNKADDLRKAIASAGHAPDRTKARKTGAATRG